MADYKRITFNTSVLEVVSSNPYMEVVADLTVGEAENALFSLCEQLGYARVWELIEPEIRETSPMEGEMDGRRPPSTQALLENAWGVGFRDGQSSASSAPTAKGCRVKYRVRP